MTIMPSGSSYQNAGASVIAVATDVAGGYRFTECNASRHRNNDPGGAWMAKDSGTAAGRLSALVADIEAVAYARGQADARKEFLAALGAAEKPAPRPRRNKPPTERPAGKGRTNAGKRAPRGAVRTLIERALRERPGSAPPDILACAATDGERLVKLTSIRVELHTGRREGRYESRDGRWSLAGSPSAPDDGAPDASESPAANVAASAPDEVSPSEAGSSRDPGETASAATGDAPGENAEARQPESNGSQGRLGMNW